MKKQFLKIDTQGYYIEPVILQPIFADGEGNKYYFPEEFIGHFVETEGGKPVEITEEFITENRLPELNCRTPKEYMIDTPFTDGMYKPRWTGTEWIDEITQEELDEKRLQAKLEREREMLENPTEQMILGRQITETELNNILLEQQVDLLKQQNMMLANLVTDMELKMIEQINDSESDENV